jgi:hypothetical protein
MVVALRGGRKQRAGDADAPSATRQLAQRRAGLAGTAGVLLSPHQRARRSGASCRLPRILIHDPVGRIAPITHLMTLELESIPDGDFTFLDLAEQVRLWYVRGWPRFHELSLYEKARIPEEKRAFWRRTLDGPRYRRHQHPKGAVGLENVGAIAGRVIDKLTHRGFSPDILEGDVPFFD